MCQLYAECALEAGVGFVNCTPDIIGRNENFVNAFKEKGFRSWATILLARLDRVFCNEKFCNCLQEEELILLKPIKLM